VKVFANGLRTFALHDFIGSAERLYTIGRVGDLTLLAASRRREPCGQMIDRGEDPLVARSKTQAKAAGADLAESIFEKWLVHVGGMKRGADGTPTFSGKLRSAKDRMRIFERLVYPEVTRDANRTTLRGKALEEVTRTDIARLLDHIEDKNGKSTADLTLAYMFHWYESRSDSFRSPIVKGMKRQKPEEHRRDRILSDDELRAVWNATGNGETSHRFTRFVLLTGARRSEAAEMPWDEIHVVPTSLMAEEWAAHWALPEARNKTKEELVRPLSKLALATLPKHKGRFVFSTDAGATFISGLSKMRAALSKASETSGWTFHDLRRTSRTLKEPRRRAERHCGALSGSCHRRRARRLRQVSIFE
jgi:integrase